ncbi:MAG TPA: YciI family protein [Chloroflexia bacterium]|nr:YciI family protein [Chloroflexia bacterium]
MQTFVVFRKAGSAWVPNLAARQQPYWDEHAEFMDRLFETGQILLGGPFDDGSGALLIIRVENEQAAQTIFEDDPWTVKDIQDKGEVKAWQIFLNAYQK